MAPDPTKSAKYDKTKKQKVNNLVSEWLIVLIVVFTLVVETILHKIEHWIKHKHSHLSAVVNVLYRELMILGIISFTFVIYELTEKPDKPFILTFEYAHLFIFLLAVFYTIVVLCSMFASLRLSATWKRMEQIDLVEYLHKKSQYTTMRREIHKHQSTFWRKIHWWFPNFPRLLKYQRLHELMVFHDIRFQVIFYRNLPEHFRFSSFLRRVKAIIFVELVESHWTITGLFLIFVLVNILRRSITDDDKGKNGGIFESAIITAASVLLLILTQMLSMKIRHIFWELTKHPRVYFEGVEPEFVEQEIENRLEEGRVKRRTKSIDNLLAEGGELTEDDIEVLASQKKKSLDLGMAASVITSIDNTRNSMESVPPPPSLGSNQRYSLELPPELKDRGSTSDESINKHGQDHKNEVVIPLELQETAARHSLELIQPGRRNLVLSPKKNTKGANLAKEAIDAARRRSIDYDTGISQPTSINDAQLLMSSRGPSLDDEGPHSTEFSRASMERRSLQSGRRSMESERKSIEGGRRSLEGFRRSIESKRRSIDGGRRSIELAAAIPRDELVQRHNIQTTANGGESIIKIETDEATQVPSTLQDTTVEFQSENNTFNNNHNDNEEATRQKSVYRSKSLGFLNNTIMRNLEVQQNAINSQPEPYPWIILKLIPRLGRVASPVEKLFWFGSHRFFMWLIQFVLFFATVNLAASSAYLSVAFVESRKIIALNYVSVGVSAGVLILILYKIAGIVKRYIFIIHNASLVPEAVALDAIHNVTKKGLTVPTTAWSNDSDSDDEEEDAEAAAEQRSKIGNFLRTESAHGHVRGIEAGVGSGRLSSSSDDTAARQAAIRKQAIESAKRRVRSDSESFGDLPSARQPIYIPSSQT